MSRKPLVIVNGWIREEALAKLQESVEVRQWTQEGIMPREILKEWLVDADGLFSVRPLTVDADLVEKAQHLKVVAQPSVGYDNINITDMTAKGIPVGNTPGVLNETVGELAFTLICAASRRILENHMYVASGAWVHNGGPQIKGVDLSRRTLGIIGMGGIGVTIARRANAFNMDVLYHNRHPRQDDSQTGAQFAELDALLAKSDVVCVMAPLTEATKYMCNDEFFRKMKKSALFVNVGRGKIVDTDALVRALQMGEIDYAALDVTDPEPLPQDHPLLATDRVLIVPHIGSFTDRTRSDMYMLTVDNLIAGVNEQPLITCVNQEVNYK